MPVPTPLPRTNSYRTFAQKLGKLAQTVQMHSNEVDALVTINKKRPLTAPEHKRYLALDWKLDRLQEMFSDVPGLQLDPLSPEVLAYYEQLGKEHRRLIAAA